MKKGRIVRAVLIILFLILVLWFAVRSFSTASCTEWPGGKTTEYSEEDKVFSSVSLSYLVYGCEDCENLSGTISEILDTQRMGIIIENVDITRTDKSDPSSAMIDSASFIRQTVGDFRFMMDQKDAKSGFYGAVFADDKNKTIWISYTGSRTFSDAITCALLVLGPNLSKQEKCAFELYEAVLKSEEIKNGYHLMICGHSLGGALATMVSRMSGVEALTINGADGVALSKINGIAGEKKDSFPTSNYLVHPQKGSFAAKEILQHMMFWGDYDGIGCHLFEKTEMGDNSHGAFSFVRFEGGDLTKPYLPDEIK